jgi:hypothetical protein
MADDLLKSGTFGVECADVPLDSRIPEGMADSSTTGNSMISSQLVDGLIIVRHIKSISVPSCSFRVYRPMRSTHNASQGLCITSFVGNLPYLFLCRLFTWHL